PWPGNETAFIQPVRVVVVVWGPWIGGGGHHSLRNQAGGGGANSCGGTTAERLPKVMSGLVARAVSSAPKSCGSVNTPSLNLRAVFEAISGDGAGTGRGSAFFKEILKPAREWREMIAHSVSRGKMGNNLKPRKGR